MEDILKKLLLIETEAENQVNQAQQQRDKLIEESLQQTRNNEQILQQKLPEIQQNLLKKAETRAEQTISELERRYEEKKQKLRELAEENKHKALAAAMQLLTQVGDD